MIDNSNINHQIKYRSDAILGFTLVELMISLVLGLLISAAVMQVYLINTRTITVQQSASEVQDSTIFAMQALEEHIRIANLGNPIFNIDDKTDHGGVVLTKSNLGSNNNTEAKYFTASTGSTGWTGPSNIKDIGSDQLTIQYKNITPNTLYDCKGGKISANSNEWVIERYFVRSSSNIAGEFALACDAGRVDNNGLVTSAFSGNGEVMVPAVDQFKVLLGTQTGVNELTYLPAKTYLELTDKPSITTVKIGIIVRSNTPLIMDGDRETFTILGKPQTLKANSTGKKYYRRSYESTVLLRNARIMALTGVSVSK